MKRKAAIAIGCTLALAGIAIYSYYHDSESQNLIAASIAVFWIAIVLGIIVKLIRVKRGSKVRDAFGPLLGAADAYQSIVLSRPRMDDIKQDEARSTSTDRFTTGP